MRRKLDRATQFANDDFRNGSIDASQYEATPFMRERSSHRARIEDICSSSAKDVTPVQHKNAKKAHRERRTRTKKIEESLEMAKQAKIALFATHDMSASKIIFEINHGGKTRLTEISETVSCNCCFARGSDFSSGGFAYMLYGY